MDVVWSEEQLKRYFMHHSQMKQADICWFGFLDYSAWRDLKRDLYNLPNITTWQDGDKTMNSIFSGNYSR